MYIVLEVCVYVCVCLQHGFVQQQYNRASILQVFFYALVNLWENWLSMPNSLSWQRATEEVERKKAKASLLYYSTFPCPSSSATPLLCPHLPHHVNLLWAGPVSVWCHCSRLLLWLSLPLTPRETVSVSQTDIWLNPQLFLLHHTHTCRNRCRDTQIEMHCLEKTRAYDVMSLRWPLWSKIILF